MKAALIAAGRIFEQQADGALAAHAQGPRLGIGTVIKLDHGRQHLFTRAGLDRLVFIDHARHGLRRNARQFGDIIDG